MICYEAALILSLVYYTSSALTGQEYYMLPMDVLGTNGKNLGRMGSFWDEREGILHWNGQDMKHCTPPPVSKVGDPKGRWRIFKAQSFIPSLFTGNKSPLYLNM